MVKLPIILTLSACSFLLTACTANVKQMEKEYDAAKEEVHRIDAAMKKKVDARRLRRVSIVNRAYLAPKIDRQHYGDPLPDSWREGKKAFSLPKPVTLSEVVNELRNVHGIIVTIDDKPRAGRNVTTLGTDGEEVVRRRQEQDFETDEIADVTERINLTGTYEEIFNHIAAIYQYDFQYERGVARFRKYVTEVFELKAIAGENSYTAGVGVRSSGSGGDEGGGSGGATGSLSSSVKFKANAYADVKNSLVNSILPEDATAEILEGTGGIVVTAPAWAMSDIRKFINQENSRLSRTILVEVAVYSVTKEITNNSAASLDLVVKDLENEWGVEFRNSGFTGSAQGSTFTGNIFSLPIGNSINLSETQLVAESFKKIGRTHSELKDRSFVRPGKATVFTNGNERRFTANITIAPIGTEQNPTLVQGFESELLETGFSLGLRGKVNNDATIMLNIRMSIRDLVSFEKLANGTIAPEVAKTEIDEDLYLAPGETVLLRSFTRRGNRISEKTGGNIVCQFWCHDKAGENEVQEFFVIVHADILAKPRSLHIGR